MDQRDRAFSCKAEAHEASEDVGRNRSQAPTIGDVIAGRFGRRDFLRGSLTATAVAATFGPSLLRAGDAAAQTASRYVFDEIEHGVDETHHVAPGYSANILIRWGDPVVPGAPEFDPLHQTAAAQEMQFGYNNDYVGYIGLPFGSNDPEHGLLCVNHEYTNEEVMFPGVGIQDETGFANMTPDLIEIEMAAHGNSIIEIQKVDGTWQVVADSPYNRRISLRSTPMAISGPAAGDPRMKTSYDAAGTRVIGTVNNCAGGITAYGSYLTAEENFHGYFWGNLTEDHPEYANYERYGVPDAWYNWGEHFSRFDLGKEPREPNRFGWIVEVDPLDPTSTPVKRTALGRFKHEGAESIVNKDGRLVVYSGDDQRFEYLYKFVSAGRVDPSDREANRDLLDHGTLYVARFADDGSLTWLPLVHGAGPLTAGEGFNSQADVLIETRRAATLLGATPLDRPEDVEPNPVNGKVYVMLTNNTRRTAEQVDGANPRADNAFGHIVEITEAGDDNTATSGTWEVLVQCGDPAEGEVGALWNPATSEDGWFACPDNCAIDPQGRLWVTTDQGNGWKKASGTADGVWALETEGAARGTGRMFYRVPVGAEMCGPCFTPDGKTLFVAVQHPASDGTKDYPGFERSSTFEDPATRWPDFDPELPPRPSVVAITRMDGGGPIGS
ncbi:MAG: PhoX family phosphatase [Rhodospirillaceae bacterium]|nr:PhoX family phosphatase [Rhodospirillaceae bacterium]